MYHQIVRVSLRKCQNKSQTEIITSSTSHCRVKTNDDAEHPKIKIIIIYTWLPYTYSYQSSDSTQQQPATAAVSGDHGNHTRLHTPSIAYGSFVQTLPDLVTPLKGYSLSVSGRSCMSIDAVSALRKVWVLIIMILEAT